MNEDKKAIKDVNTIDKEFIEPHVNEALHAAATTAHKMKDERAKKELSKIITKGTGIHWEGQLMPEDEDDQNDIQLVIQFKDAQRYAGNTIHLELTSENNQVLFDQQVSISTQSISLSIPREEKTYVIQGVNEQFLFIQKQVISITAQSPSRVEVSLELIQKVRIQAELYDGDRPYVPSHPNRFHIGILSENESNTPDKIHAAQQEQLVSGGNQTYILAIKSSDQQHIIHAIDIHTNALFVSERFTPNSNQTVKVVMVRADAVQIQGRIVLVDPNGEFIKYPVGAKITLHRQYTGRTERVTEVDPVTVRHDEGLFTIPIKRERGTYTLQAIYEDEGKMFNGTLVGTTATPESKELATPTDVFEITEATITIKNLLIWVKQEKALEEHAILQVNMKADTGEFSQNPDINMHAIDDNNNLIHEFNIVDKDIMPQGADWTLNFKAQKNTPFKLHIKVEGFKEYVTDSLILTNNMTGITVYLNRNKLGPGPDPDPDPEPVPEPVNKAPHIDIDVSKYEIENEHEYKGKKHAIIKQSSLRNPLLIPFTTTDRIIGWNFLYKVECILKTDKGIGIRVPDSLSSKLFQAVNAITIKRNDKNSSLKKIANMFVTKNTIQTKNKFIDAERREQFKNNHHGIYQIYTSNSSFVKQIEIHFTEDIQKELFSIVDTYYETESTINIDCIYISLFAQPVPRSQVNYSPLEGDHTTSRAYIEIIRG